ncbi:MAG: hypothetical protein JNM98_09285 [Rhodocyclaceae bacterium]|nr:hypothetical protein [Rhodocyclaceae bacterium]
MRKQTRRCDVQRAGFEIFHSARRRGRWRACCGGFIAVRPCRAHRAVRRAILPARAAGGYHQLKIVYHEIYLQKLFLIEIIFCRPNPWGKGRRLRAQAAAGKPWRRWRAGHDAARLRQRTH